MNRLPLFPTTLHQDAAECVRDYFGSIPNVDTVLAVNSCARGKAVPESDLDFAILVGPDTTPMEMSAMESDWLTFAETQPAILEYRESSPYAHLHLDIIDGKYTPGMMEAGGGPDYFEIEIGNQVCYAAPMGQAGNHFKTLQQQWLPYYDEPLRLNRLAMTRDSCLYDLDHIPLYLKRSLYFQAFDRLYVAFQKFLQAVFIANRVYPIAYNKWMKEQVEEWLQMPELYRKLSPVLSVQNIESEKIGRKAAMLKELLEHFCRITGKA